jgi:hypothetical protein
MLIVNDLGRNTISYKPVTCYSFLALIAIVAIFDHLCRAGVPMSGWAGVNRAGTAAKARAVKQMLNASQPGRGRCPPQ